LTTPRDAIVKTSAGYVRGFKRGGVYTFRGIPYGADTSGAARFLPPRPPSAWSGVRWCLLYGPVCPQPVQEVHEVERLFVNGSRETRRGLPACKRMVASARSGAPPVIVGCTAVVSSVDRARNIPRTRRAYRPQGRCRFSQPSPRCAGLPDLSSIGGGFERSGTRECWISCSRPSGRATT
jgi:hypothetical protein